MTVLTFLLGILASEVAGFLAVFLMGLLLFIRPKLHCLLFFGLGFAYMSWHEHTLLRQSVGLSDKKPYQIEGEVLGLSKRSSSYSAILFKTDTINQHPQTLQLQIHCTKQCERFKVGSRWSILAKIKPITGTHNPGLYDKVAHFHAKHIDWQGVILNARPKAPSPTLATHILLIRDALSRQIASLSPDELTQALWQALALGETGSITPKDWEIFRHTGTTHLMVISGAHIGLVAGLLFKGVSKSASRLPRLVMVIPAQRIGAVIAIIGAILYSTLSGFAIPAQRATIASIAFFIAYFSAFKLEIWQAIQFGLWFVLLTDPHAVVMPGFYLSFFAVIILVLASERIKSKGLSKNIRLQLACLIGLMPMTLYWFSYGSVSGLFANIIAIPLVGLIIVPLALLTLILSYVLPIPWMTLPLSMACHLLMRLLDGMEHLEPLNINYSLRSVSALVSLSLGMGILWCLPKVQYKALGLMAILIGLWPMSLHVRPNGFNLQVFDIGQGLATLVNTQNHHLVFDAGIRYPGNVGDSASRVIIPFMQKNHIPNIDAIVISHPDLDHRGGLESLLDWSPNARLWVNDVEYYHHGSSCHEAKPWMWDGVRFTFLPIHGIRNRNDSSCILKVCAKSHCVLLTGDIEKEGENYLVSHHQKKLKADVLLIPHHMSKSSSTTAFIEAVWPFYAIASYAKYNRYRFPHQEVVERYKAYRIPVYTTADAGMVSLDLSPDGGRIYGYIE